MVNITAGRRALQRSGKLKASARAPVLALTTARTLRLSLALNDSPSSPRKGQKPKQQSPVLIIVNAPRLQYLGGQSWQDGVKLEQKSHSEFKKNKGVGWFVLNQRGLSFHW